MNVRVIQATSCLQMGRVVQVRINLIMVGFLKEVFHNVLSETDVIDRKCIVSFLTLHSYKLVCFRIIYTCCVYYSGKKTGDRRNYEIERLL